MGINGDNVQGDCAIWGGIEGWEITGLLQTNPHSDEPSCRLKELTEGAVTIGVRSLFQYFKTRFEKGDFLQRRRLGPC